MHIVVISIPPPVPTVNTGCMGYEEKVTMGRSIGCANSFVLGSLGGWVKDIETQEKLAITAGHAVLGLNMASWMHFYTPRVDKLSCNQPTLTLR